MFCYEFFSFLCGTSETYGKKQHQGYFRRDINSTFYDFKVIRYCAVVRELDKIACIPIPLQMKAEVTINFKLMKTWLISMVDHMVFSTKHINAVVILYCSI